MESPPAVWADKPIAGQRWADRPIAGQRTSAVAYVLEDLRGAISSGAIRIGDRLPSECALATRYSVSRAVVREVLRSLEPTGLTLTRSGKGTFVVATRPADLVFDGYSSMHLLEARLAVEVPAAALAALRRTSEHLDTLEELGRSMEAEADDVVWTRLDASFHLTVAVASGNPVFADVLCSIAAALRSQSALLNGQSDRRAASLVEHRAIGAGSATEAEDAMRYHLSEVQDALAVSMTAASPTADAR